MAISTDFNAEKFDSMAICAYSGPFSKTQKCWNMHEVWQGLCVTLLSKKEVL